MTSRSEATDVQDGFERILELLASHYGLHVRDYKPGTLLRRAQRRMGLMGFGDASQYATYLEHHLDELTLLHHDVLVGVTRFFRDPAQWEHLEREVVPRVLRAHGSEPAPPIRVWSVGCASGEEAYGLAMIFLEQLELRGSKAKLQVFATDISPEALAFARRGVYPRNVVEDVSPHRLAQFFVERGDTYQLAPWVRERVTVSRHDLLSDPPFSRLDLVCCRNLLIYLEPHAQHECVRRFHFSLLPHGVLWLGNAEGVDRHDTSFRPLAPEHCMYQRAENHQPVGLPWTIRTPSYDPPALQSPVRAGRGSAEQPSIRLVRSIERFVLARKTAACIVIDQVGHVLRLFGPTADYLMHPKGEASPELLTWVGAGLHARLRPALDQAIERSEAVVVTGAHVRRRDQTIPIVCTIEPIAIAGPGLWLITFRDEGEPLPAAAEAGTRPGPVTHAEDPLVQWLSEELQATQAELHNALDDFAGSNEEHHASYEELLSTNVALEAAAAEAKSLSAELLAVNRELEQRNTRLHAVNAELENLLAVTTVPTIFLDRGLCVRRFSSAARGVARLTAADVGRPFDDIEGRAGSERLLEDARRVLVDLVPVEALVRCEDDHWYLRRVVPFRSGDHVDGVCITFADVTPRIERRSGELEQEHHQRYELLAMLGSELRNSLSVLTHGAAILQQAADEPVKAGKVLPMLTRQTTHMTAMLDQLLELSRKLVDELAQRPVDLVGALDVGRGLEIHHPPKGEPG